MKVLKVPFSGGGLGHGNGANKGPAAVEEQCKNVFANENDFDCTFDFAEVAVDEQNIGESHQAIQKAVSQLKEKAIILGGDHSITAPAVKGFAQNVSDFQFIVFDAHPDLMDDFDPPTQEDYLRVLIEQEIVKAEDVFVIGLRNCDCIELDYLYNKGIKYRSCKEIFEKGMKATVADILDWIKKPVYLSLDIDVVDPVEAIGTGYMEHGGISSRELIYAIQQLKETGSVAMVDLVEINPDKDVRDITAVLGAKLLAELCDY
jgi:arginase family enzyme